jgi:L-gulonolactone oxidase
VQQRSVLCSWLLTLSDLEQLDMLPRPFAVLCAVLSYGVAAPGHGPSEKVLEWSNWDRLETCTPARFVQPSSEEEIATAIAGAPSVRVAGAGHSFSPIVLTTSTGVILQLDAMRKPISIRPLGSELVAGTWTPGNESYPASGPAAVQVQAGMRVHELNTFLASKGLALENSGAIAIQSVAGATSTSTHGTGRSLGSMATSLLGLTVVLANGTVIETNATARPDIFQVARVGLGALGVISRVTVRAIPLYKLRRVATPYGLKEFLPWVYPSAYRKFERMQWYFTPLTDSATMLLRQPVPFDEPIVDCWNTSQWQSAWVDPATDDLSARIPASTDRVAAGSLVLTPEGFSPVTPPRLAAAISNTRADNEWHTNASTSVPKPSGPSVICTDLAYRTLAHETDDYDLYEEMEIFVPLSSSQALIEGLIAFQNSSAPPPQDPAWAQYSLFTGMRYVAADDIPLSMMHGRDTGVVSFITLGNHSITGPPAVFEHYAKQLEQDGRDLTGRFHWGKMNWATTKDVRAGWGEAALDTFLAVQQELDPTGVFLNQYLKERLL